MPCRVVRATVRATALVGHTPLPVAALVAQAGEDLPTVKNVASRHGASLVLRDRLPAHVAAAGRLHLLREAPVCAVRLENVHPDPVVRVRLRHEPDRLEQGELPNGPSDPALGNVAVFTETDFGDPVLDEVRLFRVVENAVPAHPALAQPPAEVVRL